MTFRRWGVLGALVATASIVAGCVPPDGGGGGVVPPCPARQKVAVETTDQTDFSIARGVSANGRWLVTSRTVAGELRLSLREIGSVAPPVSVGATSTESSDDPAAVAVADDGSAVAYQVPPDEHGPRRVVRWDRATDTITPLTPPNPGLQFRMTGPDATLVAWEDEVMAPTVVVTESLTDEVVGTWTGIGYYSSGGASASGRHDGGRDHATGSSTSLQPGFDAIAVAHPLWEDVRVRSMSPSGTFALFEADLVVSGVVQSRLWSYELASSTLTSLGQGMFGAAQIDDLGRAVTLRAIDLVHGALELRDGTGVVSTLATVGRLAPTAVEDSRWGPQRAFLGTPDLRAVVYTEFPVLATTAVVQASRCQ